MMQLRRIAKFAVVGGVGFAIDAGVLTLVMRELSSVYMARALSFSCAVLVTWLLNRLYVFDPDKRASLAAEYGRYLATQIGGALTNLAVFVALIESVPRLATTPIIPLAIGAVLGALVNYAGSALWVFDATRPGR
ncbi:MAG TPA: GtrA family protein [Casimicrobiaceae bacterium]|nr:GtrA family protein [Casimicrobiaceae bacterium]